MPTAVPDLWPDTFGETSQLTPVAILRDQGRRLGEKTANVVFGDVQSRQDRHNIIHSFFVRAPALAVDLKLFAVSHPIIQHYPAKAKLEHGEKPEVWQVIDDENRKPAARDTKNLLCVAKS